MVSVERTLAIFKPDAVHRTDDIIELAQGAGFIVLQVVSHPVSNVFRSDDFNSLKSKLVNFMQSTSAKHSFQT